MAILIRDKNSFDKHIHNAALYKFIKLKGEEYQEDLLTQQGNTLIIDVGKLNKSFVLINFYAYNVEFGIDTVEFVGKQKYLHFHTNSYTDDVGYDYRAQPMTFIYKEEEYLEISDIKEVKKIIGNIRLTLEFSGLVSINYNPDKLIIKYPRKITTFSNILKKKMDHPQYTMQMYKNYLGDMYRILTKYDINNGKSNKHLYDILSEDLVYSFRFNDREVYFIKNPTKTQYKVTNGKLDSLWTWELRSPYKMPDGGLLYIKD